jgi:hypothetical protein
MANEYAVNATDLTAVADAIRTKGETTEALSFPAEYIEAINAISGGDIDSSQIFVTVETGSTVTCSKGGTVLTTTEDNGVWRFTGIENGTWTVTATKDGKTATTDVEIDKIIVIYITLHYRKVPEFTYTGEYELVHDDDTPLTDMLMDNWKIRFLTSGVLTITDPGSWNGQADVFMVGGGGAGHAAGGGSGYTLTDSVQLAKNNEYEVVIGAGGVPVDTMGAPYDSGGKTEAFGLSVNGGERGRLWNSAEDKQGLGGTGASGGGSYGAGNAGGYGGSDGSDGHGGANASVNGKGQGTTTREFGEPTGRLYAGGGSGGSKTIIDGGEGGGGKSGKPAAYSGDTQIEAGDGEENTGGGGGGQGNSYTKDGNGGSGIVIIRNHREVTTA